MAQARMDRGWRIVPVFILAIAAALATDVAVAGEWAPLGGHHDYMSLGYHVGEGVAHPLNRPDPREGAMTWTGADGALWLFGGGFVAGSWKGSAIGGIYNDLWRYDPATHQWTLIMADASSNDRPEGRMYGVTWTGTDGRLWLHGGHGIGHYYPFDYHYDTWVYDPPSNAWARKQSDKCPSPEKNATWTTPDGKFWFFSGNSLEIIAELWCLDPVTGQWTLITSTESQPLESPHPSGRIGARGWTGADGALWLAGGVSSRIETDLLGRPQIVYQVHDDIWRFDPIAGEWSWIRGGIAAEENTPGIGGGIGVTKTDGTFLRFTECGSVWSLDPETALWTWLKGPQEGPGIYGTRHVAAPENNPRARSGMAGWQGADGSLWIFGGQCRDGAGTFALFSFGPTFTNDLWQYEPASNQWIWHHGSGRYWTYGDYGTPGLPETATWPAGRYGAAYWTGIDGARWLYGGIGVTELKSPVSESYSFADLWRQDPVSGRWSLRHGSFQPAQPAVFGTQGVGAGENTPGGLSAASFCTAGDGGLWLFGGSCKTTTSLYTAAPITTADLWRFDPTTSHWTWVNGTGESNQASVYGTRGLAAPDNCPGARSGAAMWSGPDGRIWLFGGYGRASDETTYLSDLWCINPPINQWVWLGGTTGRGSYGTRGVAKEGNRPGSRTNATCWTARDGTFWLYGGYGRDAAGAYGYLSDLWRFDPVSGLWTWMHGSELVDQHETRGEPGVPHPDNTPGPRQTATGWVGADGSLMLFGGSWQDRSSSSYYDYYRNDLWRYEIASGEWSWLGGLSDSVMSGITADGRAHPQNRFGAAGWGDAYGRHYIFGGGAQYNRHLLIHGDLWRFNPGINAAGSWQIYR